jgi:hypothetical protein
VVLVFIVAESRIVVDKVEFGLELKRKVSLKKGPLVGRLGTSWPRDSHIDLRDTHDVHGSIDRNLVFAR